MPSLVKAHITDHITQPLPPAPWRVCDFLREIRNAEREVDIRLDGAKVVHGIVREFVIDVDGSARASSREVVDANPSKNFVERPWVVVCPVDEFLVDPGEEPGWRVCEGEGECCGLEERQLKDLDQPR